MIYQNQLTLDPRALQEREAFTSKDQEVIKKYMFGDNLSTAAFAVENPNSKEEDIKALIEEMVATDTEHYFLYNVCQTVLTERNSGIVPNYFLKTNPQQTTYTQSNLGSKQPSKLSMMLLRLSRIWRGK